MKEKPFNCVVCGKPWVSFGKPGKYCSNKCKCKAYQMKRKLNQSALIAELEAYRAGRNAHH